MKYKGLILLLLIVGFTLPQLSFSQRNLEKGNRLFDMNQYEKAIVFFEKELSNSDRKIKLEAIYRLADSYRLLGDFENAEKLYKKLIAKGGGQDAIFQYALALKSAAKYSEAKKEFLKYARLAPDDPRGYIYAKSCDFAQRMLDEAPDYEVRELKSINTENIDISPVYYKGGIVFSSQRAGGKKSFVNFEGGSSDALLDLYYMEFDGTESSLNNKVFFLPGLNTNLHEGPASFSANGREIYFTRTVEGERLNKTDEIVRNTLQIFHAKIQGDTIWSKPESAFRFNSIEYSVMHPCISKDGKKMFFSSNMPGGIGGTDIYVVNKQKDGSWGEPLNLGPDVNSTENELFPFYDNNENLYFSSNGHPGMGKLDIFKSSYDSLYGWTFVENMKVPVNSIGDDICYMESENPGRGLLVSDRINGTGGDDIYSFSKNRLIDLEISTKSLRIKNNTAYDGLAYSIKVDGEKEYTKLKQQYGYFTFEPEVGKTYILSARKDGFLNNKITFTIVDNEDGGREFNIIPKLNDVNVKVVVDREIKTEQLEIQEDSVQSTVETNWKLKLINLKDKLQKKFSFSSKDRDFSFETLLTYKKVDLNENKSVYAGIKAKHFINDEFLKEVFTDNKGAVSFLTVASENNKITIDGISDTAKPVEEVIEVTKTLVVEDWIENEKKLPTEAKVVSKVKITYSEIKIEELFLKIPPGDELDVKVIGQILFNKKELKNLPVEIIVDGKSKTLTQTGENNLFVAYLNIKSNNELNFMINDRKFNVILTEDDFERRNEYFELVVSVGDTIFNKSSTNEDTLSILAVAKEEVLTDSVIAVVPTIIIEEDVIGYIFNGDSVLADANLKIFEVGDFVSETKSDDKGYYSFSVKPGTIYTITAGKPGFKFEQFSFIPSELKKSKGSLQIDFTLTPQRKVVYSGQVLTDNKPVSEATLDVYQDNAFVTKTKTDTAGKYVLELQEKEKYSLSVTKPGYFQSNTLVETYSADDSSKYLNSTIFLVPIEENKAIAIPNIYFEYDRWELTTNSIIALHKLAVFLKQNPQIRVLQIYAYTDIVGSDKFNEILSQKRANSVLEYLVMKGISRDRLSATGMGEKDLVVKNAVSDEDHAKNRRTEFKVLLEHE